MEISAQDKGNYFRGLLLLIGKDNLILENEKNWFFKLGKILGYDSAFCKTVIKELPENEYLSQEPPVFKNKELAKAFIVDGIHLAYADQELHSDELFWINLVAEANGIDILWGMEEFEKFRNHRSKHEDVNVFAIEKLINQ